MAVRPGPCESPIQVAFSAPLLSTLLTSRLRMRRICPVMGLTAVPGGRGVFGNLISGCSSRFGKRKRKGRDQSVRGGPTARTHRRESPFAVILAPALYVDPLRRPSTSTSSRTIGANRAGCGALEAMEPKPALGMRWSRDQSRSAAGSQYSRQCTIRPSRIVQMLIPRIGPNRW